MRFRVLLIQNCNETDPVTLTGSACTVQGCPEVGVPSTVSATDGADVG